MKIETRLLPLLLCACLLPAAPILSDGNETCKLAPAQTSLQYNNLGYESGCKVQLLAPHHSWLEAQWISHVDSGANASMLTVPNGAVVSFFERFQIPTAPTSASIKFAADDSAALYVNGSLIVPAAPVDGNGYSLCSDIAPTCWQWTTVDIAPWLTVGTNELRFDVEQRGRYGFGLAFEGDVHADAVETPEPGTGGLAAIGITAVIFSGAYIPIVLYWRSVALRERDRAKRFRSVLMTLAFPELHQLSDAQRTESARRALE